ncbi:MAG TPA: hypothetical protein VMU51_15860, partial [Mycobacteriales bacterium]|nr:hypothetical protein [Mycobacteriales bacterium]
MTGAVAAIGIAAASGGGTNTVAQTISCPDVAGRLPAVPAAAQAEVTSNLALLQRQIVEANQRLVTSAGQGGPAFVQNAILGPLADKRVATIQRIEIAIGRHAARPTGLESLATCTLGAGGAAPPPAANPPATKPPAGAPASTPAAGSGARTISCPDVAGRLPAVPAAAQAEVTSNLALLQRQIVEANQRLVTSA